MPYKFKPIRLKVKGKFKTFWHLTDAARFFKLPHAVVNQRLRKGWTARKALTTPLRPRKANAYKPTATVIAYKASQAKPISQALH